VEVIRGADASVVIYLLFLVAHEIKSGLYVYVPMFPNI
jgi:hypothetical protein